MLVRVQAWTTRRLASKSLSMQLDLTLDTYYVTRRPQLSESSDDDVKESTVATDVTPPMQYALSRSRHDVHTDHSRRPSQRTMDREYIYISSDESDAEDAPSSRSMNSSSPIGRHHAVDHRAPSPPVRNRPPIIVARGGRRGRGNGRALTCAGGRRHDPISGFATPHSQPRWLARVVVIFVASACIPARSR